MANENCSQTFYDPICVSGYLTPLQRKKLREKRNLLLEDLNTSCFEIKKTPHGVKRKKEPHFNSKLRETNNKVKRKKLTPQTIQCAASKIVLKTSNDDNSNKKFFKSTSTFDRLEKANFTMSLAFRKKSLFDIEKCVKQLKQQLRQKCDEEEENCSPSANEKDDAGSESLFEFDWPSDEELLRRQNAARERMRRLKENVEKRKAADVVRTPEGMVNEEKNRSPLANEKDELELEWPSDEHLLRRQNEAREQMRRLKENIEKNKAVAVTPEAQPKKYFPIFTMTPKRSSKSPTSVNKRCQPDNRSPRSVSKKRLDMSKGSSDQLIIDAGQRAIGATVCTTCNMVYTVGEEEDERLHTEYHHMYQAGLKFGGWKDENVIGEYNDGRIIMVRKCDKGAKMKKIEDILTIANRDLGFSHGALVLKPDFTFMLFISNCKQVAGCLVAEPISFGCQVLSVSSMSGGDVNWCSSSEKVPAVCGINRIWVAHTFRRQKVASRLIDCLRCHFVHGHVLGIRELAFTDPSPDGRSFASVYTGTDNFLVYK